MKLDNLEYLPLLIPEVCSRAPVYEMARINFKAVIGSDKAYTDAFQVLGRGKIVVGVIHQQEIGDILYIRRINLGVDEQGNFISQDLRVETTHRILLEDIVEYAPLQAKV